MPNPSVLPDPVWARPRMSRPASASGSTAACTGNGTVMPFPASAATSGAGTPRSAKAAGPAGIGTDFSAGRTDKDDLQDLCGRIAEGATSVETNSLTERQTTGAPDGGASARIACLSPH